MVLLVQSVVMAVLLVLLLVVLVMLLVVVVVVAKVLLVPVLAAATRSVRVNNWRVRSLSLPLSPYRRRSFFSWSAFRPVPIEGSTRRCGPR